MSNKPQFPVLLWIISTIACSLYLLMYATIDTSIISIFSGHSNKSQSQQFIQSRLDSSNRIILGSIQGADKDTLAKYSESFTNALRDSKQFSFITNGASLSVSQSGNALFSYRYLLSGDIENNPYNTGHLKQAFNGVYQKLRSPFSFATTEILSMDPTGNWSKYLKSYDVSNQPERHGGVWFSNDKNLALFILSLPDNFSQISKSEEQIEFIKQIFQKTIASDHNEILLTLSGPAIFAISSRNTIRAESQQLSILATIAVLFILLYAYRSLRLAILSAIPVATAILMAATCVNLLYGSIHGITLAFGATLLGVVIDYPIHLFSHISKNKSVSSSVDYCWPTIRLGMITTVVAYSAMALADFAGLAQLGMFAMIGITAGALTTRWIVPALISTRMSTGGLSTAEGITKRLMNPHPRFAVITIGISVVIIASALFYKSGSLLQSDLKQFSSVPESSIEQYTKLRQDLRIPDSSDFIVTFSPDAESILRRTEDISNALNQLLENKDLSSYDAASLYLPSQKKQRLRQDALPDSNILKLSIEDALEGMNIKENYFQPFHDDLIASKTKSPLTPLDPLSQSGTFLGNKLNSLLFHQDNTWVSLIPLRGVKNKALIDKTIEGLTEIKGTEIHYFNSQNELSQLMDKYLNETVRRIIVGSTILLAILAFGLSSWRQLVRVITPISLGISVTAAILILDTGSLSLFHIVALLLTVGISIDYALFLSLETHNLQLKIRTLTSILICAISTIAVFGILGSSEIPVLQAIGKTVSIGVVVAFILSLSLSQQKSSPLSENTPEHTRSQNIRNPKE